MPKYTNQLWTSEEDQFLRDTYESYEGTLASLAKSMNRTVDSVGSRVSGMNLRKLSRCRALGKYALDTTYFETIDTPEKAYWYGFLWADGSVCNRVFELALQARDLYMIERFRTVLASTYPIKKHKRYNTYRFVFNNKKFAQCLAVHNIADRKSYSTDLPIITDELFFPFLAGLFDGDGTVLGKHMLSITGTPETCVWLQAKLQEFLGVSTFVYHIKGTHACRLSLHKFQDCFTVYSAMYSSVDFFMLRKYEKVAAVYAAKGLSIRPD